MFRHHHLNKGKPKPGAFLLLAIPSPDLLKGGKYPYLIRLGDARPLILDSTVNFIRRGVHLQLNNGIGRTVAYGVLQQIDQRALQ